MRPSNALITSEGYPFIAYSAGLFLLLTAGTLLLNSVVLAFPAGISLLLVLFVVSFFRNPERTPPVDADLLVAPADGTIVYVGPATQEHLRSEERRVGKECSYRWTASYRKKIKVTVQEV